MLGGPALVILQLRKYRNPVQEAALALGRYGLVEWKRVKMEGTLSERTLDGRLGSGSSLTLSTTAGCSVPRAILGRLPGHKGEGCVRLLPSEKRTTPPPDSVLSVENSPPKRMTATNTVRKHREGSQRFFVKVQVL